MRVTEQIDALTTLSTNPTKYLVVPRLVAEMFDSLRLLRAEGLTVLLVEQNVHQALELADVGYVLETGRIVLSGLSSDLLASPMVRSAYLGVA